MGVISDAGGGAETSMSLTMALSFVKILQLLQFEMCIFFTVFCPLVHTVEARKPGHTQTGYLPNEGGNLTTALH